MLKLTLLLRNDKIKRHYFFFSSLNFLCTVKKFQCTLVCAGAYREDVFRIVEWLSFNVKLIVIQV